MIARLISWLIGLPLMLVAIIFAVANRHDVRLEAWPLPWSLDLPVYLAVLGAGLIGLAAGVALSWLSGHGARARLRDQTRRAQSLERQLTAAQSSAPASGPSITQG